MQISSDRSSARQFQADAIPPNWNMAKNHALSRMVAQECFGDRQICPCCGYQIVMNNCLIDNFYFQNRLPFKISTENEKLSFLGSGYPLYFSFIKCSIIMLGIQILAVGNFNIVSNYYGTDCLTQKQFFDKINKNASNYSSYIDESSLHKIKNICLKDFITRFTLANKRTNKKENIIQDILAFNSTILLMIYLLFFRKTQKEVDIFCDLSENTPSDYTILIYDMPVVQNENYKEKITQIIEKNFEVQITKINLAYNLEDIKKLKASRHKLLDRKKNILCSQSGEDYSQVDEEIRIIDDEIQFELKQMFYSQKSFAGVAFVSFKYEAHKRILLSAGKQSIWNHIINLFSGLMIEEGMILEYEGNQQIKMIQAPEPNDVNWESIYDWAHNSIIRRILGTFAAVVISIVFIYIIYYLTRMQAQALNQKYSRKNVIKQENLFGKDQIIGHLHSLLISMVTVFINSLVIDYIVRYIVKFQAYSTFTQINISIAQKLSILMFLNSAFALFLVHTLYTKNIYGPGGLVYTAFYFFFSNAVVPPLVSVVNPMHKLKRLQFKYYHHKTRQFLLTQKEANKLLEYPEHEIEQGYADVVKTLIITFFFGPMLPIGYLVSLTGITAFYFAEKYMLLRKKTVLHCPSFELSSYMTNSLSLIPIVYSFSNFMFKFYVSSYFPWISVLGCILSILYFFLPSDKIVDCIWQFDEEDEFQEYDDTLFTQDYDRENPVTKYDAIRSWLNQSHRQKFDITEDKQDLAKLRRMSHQLQQQLSQEEGNNHDILVEVEEEESIEENEDDD